MRDPRQGCQSTACSVHGHLDLVLSDRPCPCHRAGIVVDDVAA